MAKGSATTRRHDRYRERAYDNTTGAFLGDPTELRPLEMEEGAFRHGHWKERRELVKLALAAAGISATARSRFECCGCFARVMFSPSQDKHCIRASYCRNRHCEPCMRAKANLIARNLAERLQLRARGRYRFVTLTLKHSKTELPKQIKRLYAAFAKLRRSPAWSTQLGGAFVLECKRGRDRRWHPHLHIITEGGWISKTELSNTWLKITGDSYVTDIRSIDNAQDVTCELTKYITKSTDGSVWKDEQLRVEWVVAMKGTRCCATYGTWRNWQLTRKPQDPKDWIQVCTIGELVRAAAAREGWAMQLLLELRPPGISDDIFAPGADSS